MELFFLCTVHCPYLFPMVSGHMPRPSPWLVCGGLLDCLGLFRELSMSVNYRRHLRGFKRGRRHPNLTRHEASCFGLALLEGFSYHGIGRARARGLLSSPQAAPTRYQALRSWFLGGEGGYMAR